MVSLSLIEVSHVVEGVVLIAVQAGTSKAGLVQ
jgi:hypothetical protein